jgi:hypothetical protein
MYMILPSGATTNMKPSSVCKIITGVRLGASAEGRGVCRSERQTDRHTCCTAAYDAVYSGGSVPTFQEILLLLSSGCMKRDNADSRTV